MNLAPSRVGTALALAGAVLLQGCASDYVARTRDVRRAYESYDYDRALQLLSDHEKKKDKEAEIDRLLLLLDRGMILHASGKWEESNRVLSEAEKLAAQLDVVSVGEEAKVLLSNERQKAYRGEDFEKLLINVLKALNYAQLGQDEEAMVEVRRANERLRKMVQDEKKDYEQLAIARYLSGVLWEDQGELDSAYIDYAKAAELAPGVTNLAEPLLRTAKAAGRHEVVDQLKEKHPELRAAALGRGEGELVVVVEQGLSPEKYSYEKRNDVELVSVPRYRARNWSHQRALVQSGEQTAKAEVVTSIESVAQRYLEERLLKIALKSAAGTAVKAGAAAAVGAVTKSEAVGAITFLVLASANQPDLRSWLSLPAEFQVARLRLPAGKHPVTIQVGETSKTCDVEIRPRRIAVVVLRTY